MPEPGREDQPAGQAGTSWIRPLALASRPPVAAVACRDDLGEDRQCCLLRADCPEVEAQRGGDPLEILVGEPELEQPLATDGLRAPGAHRADEPRGRAQRDLQGRVVELRIVGQHRDRGGRIDPADPGERLLGPGRDHLLGIGEPLGRGKSGPRVDHVRPPAGIARQRAQGRRDIDRTEQDQPRGRAHDVDEQGAAALGALGPNQLGRGRRGLVVELGGAEAPERAPSASTSSFAPGAAPSSSVTSAARPPSRAISANRPG